jgi:hypothetical protein
MGKRIVILMILPVLVLALVGVAQAWQGRMGGMEDPYGLVQDESDFLINPAGIAQGQGVRFYGDYCFTYTGVTDWDYNLDQFLPSGTLNNFYHFDTSGHEYSHDALVGAGFPLGPGRMGIFFTYDGMRGDYDGNEDVLGTSNYAAYTLTSDLDNFALRLMYGLPVLGMDAGLELGMAYRDEQQTTWLNTTNGISTQNYIWSFNVPERNLYPYMIPYDSQYWELMWKAGMQKQLGALGINVSLKGGAIVSSNNDYKYSYQSPGLDYLSDVKGDVTGWRIGSDIWLRYAMKEGLTLPFLVSIDYAEKNRDGNGIGTGTTDAGLLYDYTDKEQSLDLKAGGGIEKKLGNNALVAAGIYYNYLRGRDDLSITRQSSGTSDNSDFPFDREHRVILQLAGEKEISPVVALRMGLNFFYGWVWEEFNYTNLSTSGAVNFNDNVSPNGYHWGIGASLGGTIKFRPITLEPFINGGWQQLHLNGNGDQVDGTGVLQNLFGMSNDMDEWDIGGGLSILFNL